MEVDFSDLLEKSRALRSKQESQLPTFTDNIPRLERLLPQISTESRRLARSESNEAGVRLLAEYGFENDKIERTLQSIALRDAFEPIQAVADTDLEAYLNQAHEYAIVTAIEDAIQKVTQRSMRAASASVDASWEASKRDLVSLPSLRYRRPAKRLSNSTATASHAFASPFRQPRSRRESSYHEQQPVTPIYEAIVRRAVNGRTTPGASVAIATELDDALVANLAPRGEPTAAPRSVQHLHAVFTSLRYLTGEYRETPREGAFEEMRVSEAHRTLYEGSYRYLCLQFCEDKMRREIASRPVEAKRGGIPGIKADVRAYLNLVFDRGIPEQFASGVMYDGMPIWAQLYYCLRAGHVETAREIATDVIDKGCSDGSVMLFESCLQAVCVSGERRMLPKSLLEALLQDYGLVAKRGEDPYHRACYVVIARLSPMLGDGMALPDGDFELLFYSIEDYLWLLLSVVRLESDEKLPDSLIAYQMTTEWIQNDIRSFGPQHFDPRGDAPAFYALVLILTGQFAEAISYLDRGARAIAEAMHIAFTLYYYGIIQNEERENDDMKDVVNDGNKRNGLQKIEYSNLLWRYVSNFAKTDATTASVYIFTIREAGVRNRLLKRLLLETKEFELLLGNSPSQFANRFNQRRGVFQELWAFGGRESVMDTGWLHVAEAAAEEAERIGDRKTALTLYERVGAYGKVIAIHIDRLAPVLTSQGSSSRKQVFEEAVEYEAKMRGKKSSMVDGGRDRSLDILLPSFETLLVLGQFFDHLWSKQYEQARLLLDRTELVPHDEGELVTKTQELRVGGGVWADSLCERAGEILLAAMETLTALHMQSRRGGGSSALSAGELRRRARLLVSFADLAILGGPRALSARMWGGMKEPSGMVISGFTVPGGRFFGSSSALAAARLSEYESDMGGAGLGGRLGMSMGAERFGRSASSVEDEVVGNGSSSTGRSGAWELEGIGVGMGRRRSGGGRGGGGRRSRRRRLLGAMVRVRAVHRGGLGGRGRRRRLGVLGRHDGPVMDGGRGRGGRGVYIAQGTAARTEWSAEIIYACGVTTVRVLTSNSSADVGGCAAAAARARGERPCRASAHARGALARGARSHVERAQWRAAARGMRYRLQLASVFRIGAAVSFGRRPKVSRAPAAAETPAALTVRYPRYLAPARAASAPPRGVVLQGISTVLRTAPA
ncbi:Nucleoporin interacting component Nup93/Nic96 [Gracilaria domingensis]|nr:Nucleoporin interacting component Nup93/Nic96 [Gracilaria domingensis]